MYVCIFAWHPVGNSDEEPKEKPAILCTIQVKTSRHWIDNSRTRAGEPARLILLVCVLRIYVYIVCVCVCVSCAVFMYSFSFLLYVLLIITTKVFGFGGHPKGSTTVSHCFALNNDDNDVCVFPHFAL